MENDKKWYQTNTAIIGLLILFFPAGLFLMWKYAKWNNKAKWIVSGLFVLLIIAGGFGGDSNKTQTPVPVKQVEAQQVFDVPALVGKDLDQVQVVLGTPKGIDPTDQQIKLGAKEWDKTFEKDGKSLLVTYTIADKKIVDFFIESDDPSGQTQNKQHLLELGNLKENDSRYRIEFVKTIKDPSYFTGVKIIPQ